MVFDKSVYANQDNLVSQDMSIRIHEEADTFPAELKMLTGTEILNGKIGTKERSTALTLSEPTPILLPAKRQDSWQPSNLFKL